MAQTKFKIIFPLCTICELIKSKRLIVKTFFFFLFSFFLYQCANQLPPSGGEVDKIPPEIIFIFPEDGTINFDEDYIEMEFSEYVDKRSVREAIFFSPYIEGILEYSWTGTTLEIEFPEGLKKDITYTVTVGTDVVDLNNKNRMARAFTFSFSTGSEIDRRIISGRVDGSEREGIFLFAYKFDNQTDTLLNRKPDYVSQTGVDGRFILQGLAVGDYRVFAVDDKYRDLIYQQDQDLIGIPYSDVTLTDVDTIFSGLNFIMFNADTTEPRLIGSIMTDRNHLLVTFSKEVDSTVIKANNFHIIDSTDNKNIELLYAFKGKTKTEEMVLVVDQEIKLSNNIFLVSDTLRDLLGNITVKDFTGVAVSDRTDTTALSIIATEPKQKGSAELQNAQIKIFFDDAFDKTQVNNAVTFTDTFNNPVQFKISFKDDATLLIIPLQDLKPEKDYLIKLDLNKFIDTAGNKRDSIFTLKFETISGLDYTGLSGIIEDLDFTLNPILVLESPADKKFKYTLNVTKETFEFTRVEPGKYLLWCFLDKNKNKKFDSGWPNPFQHSEEYSFYPDTLNLRPRWEVTDLRFRFK